MISSNNLNFKTKPNIYLLLVDINNAGSAFSPKFCLLVKYADRLKNNLK